MGEVISISNRKSRTAGTALASNDETASHLEDKAVLMQTFEALMVEAGTMGRSPQNLTDAWLTQMDYEEIVRLWRILQDNGLDFGHDNETVQGVFAILLAHLITYAPPKLLAELKSKFGWLYPDISPVGYDDEGTPYYSVQDFATASGIEEERVRNRARKLGFSFSSVDELGNIQE
jgi:hypothetical protein